MEQAKLVDELTKSNQLAEREVERYRTMCEDLKRVAYSQQSKYASSSELEGLKKAISLADDEVLRLKTLLNDLKANIIFNTFSKIRFIGRIFLVLVFFPEEFNNYGKGYRTTQSRKNFRRKRS